MFDGNKPELFICHIHTHTQMSGVTAHVHAKLLSCARFFATPWMVAHQVPLSMQFSRQEYWSGLSFSSPEDLPNPGIEPRSPTLQADSLLSEPSGKPKNSGVVSLSLL